MSWFKSEEFDMLLKLDESLSDVFLHFIDLQNLNVVKSRNLDLVNSAKFDYCIVVAVRGTSKEKNEECYIAGILNGELNKCDSLILNGWSLVISNGWRRGSYTGYYINMQTCSFAFSVMDPDKRIAVKNEQYIDVLDSKKIQNFLVSTFLPLTGYRDYSLKLLDDRLTSIERKLDQLLKSDVEA
ncbi:MAG TPA: hypothetical protein VEB40_06375 [Flavipsychrobacter sp.]|nr:hypothetical protein [Flavipsychrobacter sp.]